VAAVDSEPQHQQMQVVQVVVVLVQLTAQTQHRAQSIQVRAVEQQPAVHLVQMAMAVLES
jgi:hypothetical protein